MIKLGELVMILDLHRQGLSVGVQIIGRMGGEASVLRAAAIERRRPLFGRRPA